MFLRTLIGFKDRVLILVHGGGKTATNMAERLGVKTSMVEGRRITNDEMLDVVTMVYGGLMNKQLVVQLQSLGINALGVCGADGDLLRANKRPIKGEIDYGWAGDLEACNTALLCQLLDLGYCPIIAPITHDLKGQLLNTNADTIAAFIATRLISYYFVRLVYVFELDGVLRHLEDPSSLICDIHEEEVNALVEKDLINKGMLPKLHNAINAAKSGVHEVSIINFRKTGRLLNKEFKDRTLIHG
jgi:acetylglutamate kinase